MDKSPKICHFCGRPDEEADILISGAYGDTFICDECIEAAHEIIHASEEAEESFEELDINKLPTPSQVHAELDRYVIGQGKCKTPGIRCRI